MGCAPDKLVVGVPFYGHTYILNPNSTSHEPGTPIDRDAKVKGGMAYYQVKNTYDSKYPMLYLNVLSIDVFTVCSCE